MRGRFLLRANRAALGGNIYADKSAVVLEWLLKVGSKEESFSIREVARDRKISVGLVQRIFETLVMQGMLQTVGVRTAKKFSIKRPDLLFKSWLKHYDIVKKCRMWTYRSAFQSKEELLKALKKAGLDQKVALALHSAAEAHGFKNTNLQTLELYMLMPSLLEQLEEALQLEPQERGYEVLLIEPYYKSLLKHSASTRTHLRVSPLLLTFLDLYHFPLRGQEQAEFMAARTMELRKIYRKNQ